MAHAGRLIYISAPDVRPAPRPFQARTRTRAFSILVSLDARLDPNRYVELAPGRANVVHCIGVHVAEETIRSLVDSYEHLGALEWIVIHAAGRTGQARRNGHVDSIVETVRQIREHPLVPDIVAIRGYLHDPETGSLTLHEAACFLGAAS